MKRLVGEEMVKLGREQKLSSLEKPKEFMLHHELMSIENNLVTSTFKLKRNVAKQTYKPMIDELYEKVAILESKRA